MSQTVIPWGDPKAQKKWGTGLAVDMSRESYWTRKFIGVGENNVIEQKTELAKDSGDRISFDLSVQLRNRPVVGDNRVDGTAENLRFFTDEVIIDQLRKQVSAGGKMSRQRVVHDLRMVGKQRLSEYMAKYHDELIFVYMSGARGVNEDFYEPTDWTGHAGNAIQAPDAQHVIFGGYRASAALVTVGDTMTRTLIEGINTRVKMLRAQDPDAANMVPVTIDGENRFCLVMSPFQEHDLRVSDTAGWLQMQRDAAAAEGRNNPIFKGGLGMIGNTILHSHESVIRFSNYGAGANIAAARALYLSRQSAVVAYGSSKGMRVDWVEEVKDAGNEPVVTAGFIVGVKKTRFNGRDFGVLAVDTAAKAPGA